MKANSDEDFQRQAEQQQQLAVTAGRKERPRFRMCLKREAGRAAYVSQLQWTRGDERRTDEDWQPRQSEAEVSDIDSKKSANTWQEEDSGIRDAPAPHSRPKNEVAEKVCGANCLRSSSTEGPLVGKPRFAVHLNTGSLPSGGCIAKSGGDEAYGEVGDRSENGDGKDLKKKATQLGSGLDADDAGEGGLEEHRATVRGGGRRHHDGQRGEGRTSSRTRTEPLDEPRGAGMRFDTVSERKASTSDGKSGCGAQREVNDDFAKADNKGERSSKRCGAARRAKDGSGTERQTERVRGDVESNLGRRELLPRRESSPSGEKEHHQRLRRERAIQRSNSDSSCEAEEISEASEKRQRRKKDEEADDGMRHTLGAPSGRKGSLPWESATEAQRRNEMHGDNTQKKSRGREKAVERRKHKEELSGGKTRHDALDRGQKQSWGKRDASSESMKTLASQLKPGSSGVRRDSLRSDPMTRKEQDNYERGAEWGKDEVQISGDRSRPEEVSQRPHFVQTGTLHRRRSTSRERGSRGTDSGEKTRERVESSAGSRRKHSRHSRSRSPGSRCQKRSRQKKERDRSSREKLLGTSTKQRRSSSEGMRARCHVVAGQPGEHGRRSRARELFSKEERRGSCREEVVKGASSGVSQLSRPPTLASSSRTTTYDSADLHVSKDGRSSYPTCGREGSKAASARRSSSRSSKRVVSGCQVSSEGLYVGELQRQEDNRGHRPAVGRGSVESQTAISVSKGETALETDQCATAQIFLAAGGKFLSTGEAADVAVGGLQYQEEECKASPRHSRHREDRRRRSQEKRDEGKACHGRREFASRKESQYHIRRSHYSGEKHRHREPHRQPWRSEWREEEVYSKGKVRGKPVKHTHEENRPRRSSGSWSNRHNDGRHSPKFEKEAAETACEREFKNTTDGRTRNGSRRRRRSPDGKTQRTSCLGGTDGGETGETASRGAIAEDCRRERRGDSVKNDGHGKKTELRDKGGEAGDHHTSWSKGSTEGNEAERIDAGTDKKAQGDDSDAVNRKEERRENKDAEGVAQAKRRRSEADRISCDPSTTAAREYASSERARVTIQHAEDRGIAAESGEQRRAQGGKPEPVVSRKALGKESCEAPREEETSEGRSRKSDGHIRRKRLSHSYSRRSASPTPQEQSGVREDTVRQQDVKSTEGVHRGEERSHKRTHSEENSNRKSLSSAFASLQGKMLEEDAGRGEQLNAAHSSSAAGEDHCDGTTSSQTTTTSRGKGTEDTTCRWRAMLEEARRPSFQVAARSKEAPEARAKGYSGEEACKKRAALKTTSRSSTRLSSVVSFCGFSHVAEGGVRNWKCGPRSCESRLPERRCEPGNSVPTNRSSQEDFHTFKKKPCHLVNDTNIILRTSCTSRVVQTKGMARGFSYAEHRIRTFRVPRIPQLLQIVQVFRGIAAFGLRLVAPSGVPAGGAAESSSLNSGAAGLQSRQLSVLKPTIAETCLLYSGTEVVPGGFLGKSSENPNENAQSKNQCCTPAGRRSCSSGSSALVKRADIGKEDEPTEDRRRSTAEYDSGDRQDISRDHTGGESDSSISVDKHSAISVPGYMPLRISSCPGVSSEDTEWRATPASSSFDSRRVPASAAPVAATPAVAASPERSLRTVGVEEPSSVPKGDCLTGASTLPREDFNLETTGEDGVCEEAAVVRNAAHAGSGVGDSAAVEVSSCPGTAAASPLASTSNIPQLLKGLASSLSLARRGRGFNQCNSTCSEGKPEMPQTPHMSGSQSDLSQSVSVQGQPFPPPKILTCAALRSRASFSPSSPPPPPPPPPLTYVATARQPHWDTPQSTCLFVPRPPSVSSVASPNSPSSSSSSFLHFPTSAPAMSESTVVSPSLAGVHTQVLADHSPVVLSLRSRQPTGESRAIFRGSGVAPGGALAEGSSVLPTSVPPPVPPAPPPPPPKREPADAGAALDSALLHVVRGPAHSRWEVGNFALRSILSNPQQQQQDIPLATSADATSTAATVAPRLAADSNLPSGSTAAGTTASFESVRVAKTHPHRQNFVEPFPVSCAHKETLPSTTVKVGRIATAHEVTGNASLGRTFEAGHSLPHPQRPAGEMHKNLENVTDVRQETGLNARTHRSPRLAGPSQRHGELHEGGVSNTLREQTLISKCSSQPYHAVGTGEPVMGFGRPRPEQETQQQETGTCRDASQAKQAFSREQLLGGVSIKRVKRTRQPQDAATAACRASADMSTVMAVSLSTAAAAAEQQADTRHAPENSRAADTYDGTPDKRVSPLKEHHRHQLTAAIDGECATAPVDCAKVPQEKDTESVSCGDSRPRRPREDSYTDDSSNSVYVSSSRSKAAVAVGESKTLKSTTHVKCCEGTRLLPQFQKRKTAEAASAAAAGAAAARRQRQRDEQVARFLQELQARYTVLGDEEAAAASTSGAVVAHSGRSQTESRSDSSDSNDTSTSSPERTSSRRGSRSSNGRDKTPNRGGRGVSGDEIGGTGATHLHQSNGETVEIEAAEDVRNAASATCKTTVAGKRTAVRLSGTATYCKADSATDTDSSMSSFFSPSSSSSESSHSPQSRRRTHPLDLLDQERRQFFRAAASAAYKLHLWKHSSMPASSAASRHEHAAPSEGLFARERAVQRRNGARALCDTRTQPAPDTAELAGSVFASETPTRSVCVWLRVLLMMRRALRRAKWANKRALAAQGAAAAAVAAAAASGAFRSYLFDEQQRRAAPRRRALRKSETLKKRLGNQNCAAEHEKGVADGIPGSSDRSCDLRSAHHTTSFNVDVKREPSTACEKDSVTLSQRNHISETETEMSEQKRETAVFLRRDSLLHAVVSTDRVGCLPLRPAAIGGGKKRTSSFVRTTLALSPARGSRVDIPATAAAVLQEMPKAQVTPSRVRRLRQRRQCDSSNRKRGTPASTQDANALCGEVLSAASRHLKSIAHGCRSSSGAVRTPGSAHCVSEFRPSPSGAEKGFTGDRCQGGAKFQTPEPHGIHLLLSTRYKAEVITGSAVEFPRQLEQHESIPVGFRRRNEPKGTGDVSEKLLPSTALKEPQRTDAGAGGLAALNEGAGYRFDSISGHRRLLSVVGGDADGVRVCRSNTWHDSDVSSTRSSSASRSPSLASADDVYETVDAGCAGLFVPTHTLEIGQKSPYSAISKKSLSCFSPSGIKWKNTVSSVAYHGLLPLGAAGLEGGEICICSLRDMRPTCIIPTPPQAKHCSAAATIAAVECVSWKHSAQATGEEHLLAVGRRGGLVEVLDVRVGESRRPAISWEAHTGPVEKLKFLSTAACVTSSPTEMYVRFWDLRGRGPATCSAAPVAASWYDSSVCTSCRCSVAAPRKKIDSGVRTSCNLCLEQASKTPFTQPLVDSRLVRSVKMNSGVSAFAVSPDEEVLAVACLCGEVQVLSLPLGPEPCEQLLSFPSVHELDCFSSLSFSPNGRGLLVCGERQFTPRMRAATRKKTMSISATTSGGRITQVDLRMKLISYPFCEMWDLQDTKQRHKMLVCASFWKHLRRYGSENRKRAALAPVLRRPSCSSQEQHQVQQGHCSQEAQLRCQRSALPSLGKECEETWSLTESPSFELPLSFFPSCVAISVNATSRKSFSFPSADCEYPCDANEGELHNAVIRPLEQRSAGNVSKSVPRAEQAESTSYVLYLNSHLSNPRRGRVITEIQGDETTKAAHSFHASEESIWSQTEKMTEKPPLAVSTDKISRKRDALQQAGLDLTQRCRHGGPPVTGQFTNQLPSANSTDTSRASVALADAGGPECCSRASEITMLNWAQDAARLFCGPLGGDFRWPCRRFVCDLWRDKVVGVGGPLHLIGAFKQWDASTGYLDSCTVTSVSQDLVSSVAADPGGGPTLLTGGRSAVSGRGSLTMWGYFTVSQMEALGLVRL